MTERMVNSLELNQITKEFRVRITQDYVSEYVGNHILFGLLDDGKEVVIKFNRIAGGAVQEFNNLLLANSFNVPSPRAIGIVQDKEESGVGFMMEKASGISLDEADGIDPECALAKAVRTLHAISLPGYGPIIRGKPQFDSSSDYHDFWLERIIPFIEDPTTTHLLEDLYNENREFILSQSPVFIHRDLKGSNVLVNPPDISIIDFEWAQGGNRNDDLAVYLYHAIRLDRSNDNVDAFFNEYFGGKKMPDQEKYNLLFYLLLAAGRVVSFSARMNRERLGEAERDLKKVVNYIDSVLKI